jgi:hypothetical protein
MTRPLTRFQTLKNKTRRGAFSLRAGKRGADLEKELVDSQILNEEELLDAPTASLMPPSVGLGGTAARASVAEHKKSQQLQPSPSQLQSTLRTHSRSRSQPHLPSNMTGHNLFRSDTMMTRSQQQRTADHGQKGYDEITECNPIDFLKEAMGRSLNPVE